jgi:hypothetical protein
MVGARTSQGGEKKLGRITTRDALLAETSGHGGRARHLSLLERVRLRVYNTLFLDLVHSWYWYNLYSLNAKKACSVGHVHNLDRKTNTYCLASAEFALSKSRICPP